MSASVKGGRDQWALSLAQGLQRLFQERPPLTARLDAVWVLFLTHCDAMAPFGGSQMLGTHESGLFPDFFTAAHHHTTEGFSNRR